MVGRLLYVLTFVIVGNSINTCRYLADLASKMCAIFPVNDLQYMIIVCLDARIGIINRKPVSMRKPRMQRGRL